MRQSRIFGKEFPSYSNLKRRFPSVSWPDYFDGFPIMAVVAREVDSDFQGHVVLSNGAKVDLPKPVKTALLALKADTTFTAEYRDEFGADLGDEIEEYPAIELLTLMQKADNWQEANAENRIYGTPLRDLIEIPLGRAPLGPDDDVHVSTDVPPLPAVPGDPAYFHIQRDESGEFSWVEAVVRPHPEIQQSGTANAAASTPVNTATFNDTLDPFDAQDPPVVFAISKNNAGNRLVTVEGVTADGFTYRFSNIAGTPKSGAISWALIY